MTGPEHYEVAEDLIHDAHGVMNYEHGIYASMGTDERLKRWAALCAEAQVHATLALAAAFTEAGQSDNWQAAFKDGTGS
jgi:hypothetical protein